MPNVATSAFGGLGAFFSNRAHYPANGQRKDTATTDVERMNEMIDEIISLPQEPDYDFQLFFREYEAMAEHGGAKFDLYSRAYRSLAGSCYEFPCPDRVPYGTGVSKVIRKSLEAVREAAHNYFRDGLKRPVVVKKLWYGNCPTFIDTTTGAVASIEAATNSTPLSGATKATVIHDLYDRLVTSTRYIPYELYLGLLFNCLPFQLAPRVLDFYFDSKTNSYYMVSELPDDNLDLFSLVDLLHSGATGFNLRDLYPDMSGEDITSLGTHVRNVTAKDATVLYSDILAMSCVMYHILGIYHNDIDCQNIVVTGHSVATRTHGATTGSFSARPMFIDFGHAHPVEMDGCWVRYASGHSINTCPEQNLNIGFRTEYAVEYCLRLLGILLLTGEDVAQNVIEHDENKICDRYYKSHGNNTYFFNILKNEQLQSQRCFPHKAPSANSSNNVTSVRRSFENPNAHPLHVQLFCKVKNEENSEGDWRLFLQAIASTLMSTDSSQRNGLRDLNKFVYESLQRFDERLPLSQVAGKLAIHCCRPTWRRNSSKSGTIPSASRRTC